MKKFYLKIGIAIFIFSLFFTSCSSISDSFNMGDVSKTYNELNIKTQIIYTKNYVLDKKQAADLLVYIKAFQRSIEDYIVKTNTLLYTRLLTRPEIVEKLNETLDKINSFLVNIISKEKVANNDELIYFINLLDDVDTKMYFIEYDRTITYDGVVSDYIKYFLIFIIFFFVLCIVLLIIFVFELKQRDMKIIETSKFLNYTIEGQEEEKQRIARELHDSLAQDIRYVIQLTKNLEPSDLQKQILKNQKDCLKEVRDICSSFIPPDIENKDLASCLDNILIKLQTQTNIETKLTILDDINFKNMSEEKFLNFFRIIQEILHNAQEHSRATEVSILIKKEIIEDNNYIRLIITDDGIGIDKQILKSIKEQKINIAKNHFGIRNIIQRVKLMNGEIEFTSEKDFGTEISIIFPE